MLASFTSGDAARYLLAFFLLVVGLTLGWALLKLAAVLSRLASFLRGAEREGLAVVTKVGTSVDHVNAQLEKMDTVTDSAVDAVQAVDHTVRTLSFAVRRPVEKLVGATSGISHGWATLRKRRDWKSAVESAKEASARREADFEDEIKQARG